MLSLGSWMPAAAVGALQEGQVCVIVRRNLAVELAHYQQNDGWIASTDQKLDDVRYFLPIPPVPWFA